MGVVFNIFKDVGWYDAGWWVCSVLMLVVMAGRAVVLLVLALFVVACYGERTCDDKCKWDITWDTDAGTSRW